MLHMELVSCGNNDRLHLWISQHLVVVLIGHVGLVDGGHPRYQIFCQIADGIQLGVARSATGFKVGSLRNRPTAEYPNP